MRLQNRRILSTTRLTAVRHVAERMHMVATGAAACGRTTGVLPQNCRVLLVLPLTAVCHVVERARMVATGGAPGGPIEVAKQGKNGTRIKARWTITTRSGECAMSAVWEAADRPDCPGASVRMAVAAAVACDLLAAGILPPSNYCCVAHPSACLARSGRLLAFACTARGRAGTTTRKPATPAVSLSEALLRSCSGWYAALVDLLAALSGARSTEVDRGQSHHGWRAFSVIAAASAVEVRQGIPPTAGLASLICVGARSVLCHRSYRVVPQRWCSRGRPRRR